MYEELLNNLLSASNHKLKLKDLEVTSSSLRAGLNRALTKFNQTMALCELPVIKGRVTVSQVDDVTIIALDSTSPSDKLKFTIVED